jgi:hypothetical protein
MDQQTTRALMEEEEERQDSLLQDERYENYSIPKGIF